jgi:hypothetical protein
MIYERNWRDYLVAAPLSFVKYIGYLAFPLQMTATYPHLSRGFWSAAGPPRWCMLFPCSVNMAPCSNTGYLICSSTFPQIMGRHIRGLLTAWMLLGSAIIVPALFIAETSKSMVGLSIALVAVFLCPRLVFYPILSRKN